MFSKIHAFSISAALVGCGELSSVPSSIKQIHPVDVGFFSDMNNDGRALDLGRRDAARDAQGEFDSDFLDQGAPILFPECESREIIDLIQWLRAATCIQTHTDFAICRGGNTNEIAFFDADPPIIQAGSLDEGGWRLYRAETGFAIQRSQGVIAVSEQCRGAIQAVYDTLVARLQSAPVPTFDAGVEPDVSVDAEVIDSPDVAIVDASIPLDIQSQPERIRCFEVGDGNVWCCDAGEDGAPNHYFDDGSRLILLHPDSCETVDLVNPRHNLICCP